ncbi:high mobility group protein 20A [Drosophila persimilis]|uniref:high mobility group protein 20A n=1 Tax=Drosophila persimilis TaxID=7234 RepID=UPI000F08E982|nr:high mobility group protein 20A [Drosophila persimilis]
MEDLKRQPEETEMTEPSKEVPDEAVGSPETRPIASQSLDSAPIEAHNEEGEKLQRTTAGKGNKKNKNSKGPQSDMVMDPEIKKLTQRRINVAGAPKMPLNGYVRFMNDRREELRREQPQRTALEHTKIIGEEWHLLPEERKVPYMEAAAKDKALYQEQMHLFFKDHPEIVAKELARVKKATKGDSASKEKTPKAVANNDVAVGKGKKPKAKTPATKRPSEHSPDPDDVPLSQVKRTPTPTPPPPPPPPQQAQAQTPATIALNIVAAPRPLQPGEIPIYTNEFIEHNRSTENELRTLRKTKTDLEQQNAVLEQHVDNTKAGYAKVMGEVAELKEENVRLEAYVKGLRQKLVAALNGVPLPPLEPSGPSVGNIDRYMHHLAGLTGQPHNTMLLKARDALRKVDIPTLLKS